MKCSATAESLRNTDTGCTVCTWCQSLTTYVSVCKKSSAEVENNTERNENLEVFTLTRYKYLVSYVTQHVGLLRNLSVTTGSLITDRQCFKHRWVFHVKYASTRQNGRHVCKITVHHCARFPILSGLNINSLLRKYWFKTGLIKFYIMINVIPTKPLALRQWKDNKVRTQYGLLVKNCSYKCALTGHAACFAVERQDTARRTRIQEEICKYLSTVTNSQYRL